MFKLLPKDAEGALLESTRKLSEVIDQRDAMQAELTELRAELEAQLAERDQQVAEACAAECEGIDAINSRGWGDFLAKRIRSGEWKKHMKGVE